MHPLEGLTTPEWTVADLLARFGPIPHRRVRQDPPPGAATEQDVLDIYEREKRLYELVDGVLVEKTMGIQQSFLAALLVRLLGDFAAARKLGFVLGADGMARLAPGLIRIPDVSFISWAQVPGRKVPRLPMLNFAPVLAVEALSPGNTQEEMDRQLQDYFATGVQVVWYIDDARRTVQVFTAVDQSTVLREPDTLTGDPVLPGFALPLGELFADLEQ
jgi:Uma2 family endonuclease